MNGLDGWTCSIFRNTSPIRSSELILWAELELFTRIGQCGPSGMLTYVWDKKVASSNKGYCYKQAGWVTHPEKPRSADKKKSLIWKPFVEAGINTHRLRKLRKLLEGAFCPETAFPGTVGTGSAGHCAAVALLVQRMFGYELASTKVEGQSHWFNRFAGRDIDLTGDQFGRPSIQVALSGELYPETRLRMPTEANDETLSRSVALENRLSFGSSAEAAKETK
jgi:hypothetical protein